MAFPVAADAPVPEAGPSSTPTADTAPPLVPQSPEHSPEHSPWWSAPSGRPVSIPDFAHEFTALLAWLFPAPQPIPVRVKTRRR